MYANPPSYARVLYQDYVYTGLQHILVFQVAEYQL